MLKMHQVAEPCGMTVRDVRNLLTGAKIARYSKRRWWVSADQLAEAFPAMYRRVFKHFVLDAKKSARGQLERLKTGQIRG